MPMEKTFDAAAAEQRLYEAWEKAGCFTAGANASRPETFCIMIPPPNVTGSLHMGHAFNNTLQDILVRWHRMRGFDTLWQPGQDHAGIATQMVVERELAKEGNPGRREMGREAFLEKVWDWKGQSGGTIITQLKRLGASCDWSRNAFTMSGAPGAPAGEDGNFHDAVIKVFVEMYNKGLIYRGKRLVNWDPHFETAISDLEVEQVELDGNMWRLRYPLEDGATYEHPVEFDEEGTPTAFETRDYLVVATTRPETMLGDTGVAVHPEDDRYRHLIGKTVRLPLCGRSIPIVADDYADPTKGTGAVKITPAHDFNDWGVGQRTGLRAINIMSTRAAMFLKDNADFAEGCDDARVADCIARFDGLDRYEARKAIVADAEARGWLDGIDSDRHMVPHGDRSKTAIEPYLTDQWFVDTQKIVGPALDTVRKGMAAQEAGQFDETAGYTRILPERDAKTYFHWLENIEPWCISRQLWWGHQIPVWYGLDLDASHFTDDEGDNALDDVELYRLLGEGFVQRGARHHCAADFEAVKAQFQDVLAGLPAPLHAMRVVEVAGRAAAEEALAESLAEYNLSQDPTGLIYPIWRDPDVLDTWFSSGLWPIGTLGWPEETPELAKYFPTDVLITGFDIIFFWVARMMMMQLAVVDQVPFHTVYVHALVRDEKGKKMSKSLGNVLDPLELIDEYGADAVRFTLTAMAAMGRDLKLSTSRIAGYRNFGTKLWNATRFAEMNGVFEGYTPTGEIPAPTETVNTWIVGETARVREAVDEALSHYRFNDAANALYAFVWGKVCDWYVEFSKPLLMDGTEAQKAETRATMAWVIDQCLILLHPIMPYITEELWGTTAERAKMLVHADWPAYGADLIDLQADREMNWVIALIEEIRSARAQMNVPAGAKIPMLYTELDAAGQDAWARNEALIRRMARIDSLSAAETLPKGCVTIAVEGGSFALPLAGIIDVAAERARLEKTLSKLEKDLKGLEGRLKNPKFVESAPEDVVEETRDLVEAKTGEAAKLRGALERLAELG
ncbi:valyl-tRNA synthetase [Rhodovulum sulfidophilum]|uniref:valine--tRNA ligase n=1 Tax=Rhodovulum sulfidophilum TaxID=35806 RepID=UPI0005AA5634|nr:valine--tRNA ligase [Rhodovulum sulfidophilum]ANB34604.1 valine--tRNA ligase [Rhodovulum sulfidophilum DSM 1374]ANB38427.1 valine--tRNA ligase [Rhodovulum sulfidophilum]MCW2305393.1 valyl-tRNA synthetase [Rhodovulum sulfidophilum]